MNLLVVEDWVVRRVDSANPNPSDINETFRVSYTCSILLLPEGLYFYLIGSNDTPNLSRSVLAAFQRLFACSSQLASLEEAKSSSGDAVDIRKGGRWGR